MRFYRHRARCEGPRHLTLILFLNFFLVLLAFVVFLPASLNARGHSIISPRVMSLPLSSAHSRTITILNNQSVYIGSQPVSPAQMAHSFEKIPLPAGNNILVKIGRGVSVEFMARVVDLLKEAGFSKINIALHE